MVDRYGHAVLFAYLNSSTAQRKCQKSKNRAILGTSTLCITVVLVWSCFACFVGIAPAEDRHTDEICQRLFETYIARQVKINNSTIMAASHIVAERGRENGFWKIVLAELKKDKPQSEIGCVRVLGKMLAIDASARDVIRRRQETGEIAAWDAHVCLGPEVVAELIERGKKADRFRVDHYAIALARARVPEARSFFESVLREGASNPEGNGGRVGQDGKSPSVPAGFHHLASTRFHAAVGLAQLGDPVGIDWLLANSEYTQGTVANALPPGAALGGDLNSCCVAALRQLSDQQSLTSKAEWEAWWKTADRKRLLNRVVTLGDS